MNDEKTAALENFAAAVEQLITAGLNDIAAQSQEAAERVAGLMEARAVDFRVTTQLPEGLIRAELIRRQDGKAVELFSVRAREDFAARWH